MKTQNLAKAAKNLKTFVIKRSPEILTAVGITGMITTTILAVRATPKAIALIEEEKLERYKIGDENDLTAIDIVKTCWKCYIPATITGVTSTICLIGASSVNAKRTAALAAACQLSETALAEYREKVIETVGEKKEQAVREKVSEKKLEQNPVETKEIISTGQGSTRCFDPLSNMYFDSDIEFLRRAENRLNKRLIHEIGGYVTVNDFYDELNLPHTDLGDIVGWNCENQIDLDITAKVASDGKPAIVVGHYTPPRYEYCH